MVAEVVAGGGEMEPGRVSRVPRAALDALLTCPLCKGYFREASAFAECGHTCEFSSLFYPAPAASTVSFRPPPFPVFFATSSSCAVASSSRPRVAVASRCRPVCLLSLPVPSDSLLVGACLVDV